MKLIMILELAAQIQRSLVYVKGIADAFANAKGYKEEDRALLHQAIDNRVVEGKEKARLQQMINEDA